MIKIVLAGHNFLVTPPYFEGLPPMIREKYDRGEYTEIPDLLPSTAQPDWDRLLNRLLSGDLHPLFRAITLAAFSNPLVLIARNDIYGAISNQNINDRLGALRAGLDMLLASGYEVSPENKNLWNQAIAELNFDTVLLLE